jgi:molybdopterin molybdotransferase
MSLVPVDQAVTRLLAGIKPLAAEEVALADAADRVLAEDLQALRTQPPFAASAMDGYAVRAAEAKAGTQLNVIGMSRAGERFAGALGRGEAVRIFTGAPLPDGADSILLQEDAERSDDSILLKETAAAGRHIRAAGLDFRAGEVKLHSGRVFDPHAISLAASLGYAAVPVRRKPRVAVLANGDELVPPGTTPGPDQIISSNAIGLVALVRGARGDPIDLGIAADKQETIAAFVDRAVGADILVVTGGASVGEHDLVQEALKSRGMQLDFWKIAMRPGKPLMVGRMGATQVLGLPGNPVSTFVCAELFLRPLIRATLGLSTTPDVVAARLGAPMSANDNREDYVRGCLSAGDEGLTAVPFPLQDSSMLSTLAAANALIIRPAGAPAAAAGDLVSVLRLPR